MISRLLIFFMLLASNAQFAQKNIPFVGTLTYEIKNLTLKDEKPTQMLVLSCDSIVRIETESKIFGRQSYIKHLIKNKSYLLISLSEGQNYAIRGDFSKTDSSKQSMQYLWKKKFGFRKIGGLSSKKIKLTHLKSEKSFNFYYSVKFSAKYNDVYADLPGLPTLYYVETEDGVLEYRLRKYTTLTPSYDLFGIPSDYQKVTFDEFVDLLNNGGTNN